MAITMIGNGNMQEKVWQGICKSPSAELNKAVDVGAGFELKGGVKIRVYFKGNSLSNFTLNVNNTGDIEVIPADGYELYAGLINQGYYNFTYTETEWGESGAAFPAWVLDNIQTGGVNTYGVVRVVDGPSPNFRASQGIAASPKALQAVKDAVLPKVGGTIQGNLYLSNAEKTNANLTFEIDGEGEDSKQRGVYFVDVNAAGTAPSVGFGVLQSLQSYDGVSDTPRSSVTTTVKNQILQEFISTGQIVVALKHTNADGTNSNLNIRNTGTIRQIYGLTDPTLGYQAATKDYVDKMIGGFAWCSGSSSDVMGDYTVTKNSDGTWTIKIPDNVRYAKVSFNRDNVGSNSSAAYQTSIKSDYEDTAHIFGAYSNGGVFVLTDTWGATITVTNGANVNNASILIETLKI